MLCMAIMLNVYTIACNKFHVYIVHKVSVLNFFAWVCMPQVKIQVPLPQKLSGFVPGGSEMSHGSATSYGNTMSHGKRIFIEEFSKLQMN